MSFLKSPVKNGRVPNAFLLFVKEQKKDGLQKLSDENKAMLGSYFGEKWRAMSVEEKQVYFDKYEALKRLKKIESDSSSAAEGKLTASKNANNCAISELSTDIYTFKVDIAADKPTIDESFSAGETFRKHESDSTPLSSMDDSQLRSVAKQKPSKKVRRSPNPFVIFAKEQRHNIDKSIKTDKKCHLNSILGNMWQELPNSQKAKYYVEAKRLMNLNKKPERDPSPKIRQAKTKKQLKKIPKMPEGRLRKKKKIFSSDISTNSRIHEVKDTKKTETESNLNKHLHKIENTGSTNPLSEPHGECPNSSHLHQHNSVMDPFQRMSLSVEPYKSKSCCCQTSLTSRFTHDSLKQNYTSDMGMSNSCFGAGSYPPLFPSYPFNNMSPWMYYQAMAHRLFPVPSSFCPPSYSYGYPYSYNNAYNAYAFFGSYSNQYSERITEPSSYTSHLRNPATAACANNSEESAEATEKKENSDEEQVVVDEENQH